MIAVMAVFGVAWFAACDSEDEPASNNPPGDETEWNSENNGTYYRYYNELDYRTYLVLSDGEIRIYDDTPATVEIDGTDITVTVDMGEGMSQVLIGTISDGVIWFNHLLGYDGDEVVMEQTDAFEVYCKEGATPPSRPGND